MNYSVSAVLAAQARDELLRLWRRNFSGDWDDWYSWVVERNPYGPMANWLVATEAGHAVGSTGLMVRPMKVADRVRQVGQAVHINVDPEHRSALPAMKLQRALTAAVQDTDLPFVCGVTETAIPVLTRCGYQLLGKVGRWIKPLRSNYKLKQRIANPWACRAASAVVNLALRMRSAETYYWRGADSLVRQVGSDCAARRSGLSVAQPLGATGRAGVPILRQRRGVRVHIERQFDERFDRLWEAAAPLFPLIGARTQNYLTWRFNQRPKTDCEAFCLSGLDEELLGYVVFARREATDNADYLQIRDFFYRSEAALRTLLAEFCRFARSQDADAISLHFLGNPAVAQSLRRFGFYERGYRLQVLVYVNPGAQLVNRELVLDSTRWHLTEAELEF